MILTHQRNTEILKTYESATKGKHNGSHILRFVPQEDTNAVTMKTADMLLFVKSRKESVES